MDIEVGSNLFRNTNGAVNIEGVPHLTLETKPSNGALLLNIALFDQSGRFVAKVVDSTLAFNERRAYELSKTPTSVEIKESEVGTVVFRVARQSPERLTIDQGKFWTIKGHLCTITPNECRIDKHTITKQETDAKGGPAALGG